VSIIDPECAGIVRAFSRRTPKRPPSRAAAGRDPMFRKSGASFDLKNIREYSSSDDPRRIDWRLEGRTGRLFVKEYYDEERDGIAILADLSDSIEAFDAGGGGHSTGSGNAARSAATRFAASIAWMLGALGLPTMLMAFAKRPLARLDRPRGGRSLGPIESFFAGLAESGSRNSGSSAGAADSRRGTDIGSAMAAARRVTRYKRIVLVSDFFDPRFKPGASPFSHNLWIRLYRPFGDLDPGRGEVEVVDPETGARIRLPWDAAAKAAYGERERKLESALRECERRGAFYRLVNPTESRAVAYWEILGALYA